MQIVNVLGNLNWHPYDEPPHSRIRALVASLDEDGSTLFDVAFNEANGEWTDQRGVFIENVMTWAALDPPPK